MSTAADQERAFRRIWQAFRAVRHVSDGRHDTEAWSAREGVFALCSIVVPASHLEPSLDRLRMALAPFPFVRLHPDHFLHIPLQELGFVCNQPTRPDEISQVRLEEFANAAAGPMSELAPFPVTLGGANSFQDAPFLDVHDDARCAPIHARLFELAATTQAPSFPFLPHATVAHYTKEAPTLHLTGALSPWRNQRFGSFQVDQVQIVTLRLDEPYPDLETFAALPLLG